MRAGTNGIAKTDRLTSATADFQEHGYVILPGYLGSEVIAPAQRDLGLLFPTSQEYHSNVDPVRNARFVGNSFAGMDTFPYKSVEWSLLGLCPDIAELAAALLGTHSIRLYEAHNWAKYGGATEYDQLLHQDFGNHTMAVPTNDPAFGEVEMFIYVHDVPIDAGPTYVVSHHHTARLPQSPLHLSRKEHPDIYRHEVAADGPAGTVLAYKTSTFHRGSGITDPLGSRFVIKVSFRHISDIWFDRLGLSEKINSHEWRQFLERTTPRQLELVGFPPRGHRYWTEETWIGTTSRYPTVDFSAFRPS